MIRHHDSIWTSFSSQNELNCGYSPSIVAEIFLQKLPACWTKCGERKEERSWMSELFFPTFSHSTTFERAYYILNSTLLTTRVRTSTAEQCTCKVQPGFQETHCTNYHKGQTFFFHPATPRTRFCTVEFSHFQQIWLVRSENSGYCSASKCVRPEAKV